MVSTALELRGLGTNKRLAYTCVRCSDERDSYTMHRRGSPEYKVQGYVVAEFQRRQDRIAQGL